MQSEGFFARYPRLRQHAEHPGALELLAFLNDPDTLYRMMLINDLAEMAPLSAVVEELESRFETRIDLASLDVRQMIGTMIKDALGPFGYELASRTLVRNSRYFKVSARYQKTGLPKLILQRTYQIIAASK